MARGGSGGAITAYAFFEREPDCCDHQQLKLLRACKKRRDDQIA
jgi:hypothetical protein